MSQAPRRDDEKGGTSDDRDRRLEMLFSEFAPRILDYARHRGATLTEAEDAVSEVFIVLTRRLDDAPVDVLPWLYAVARRVLANQVRGKRRGLALRQRLESQMNRPRWVSSPASTVAARDVLIREGLRKLPPREREAVLLVAWDGLTYEEAAHSLGCTRPAFSQLVYRARQHLAELVGGIRTYEEIGDTEEDPGPSFSEPEES